MGCVGSCVKKVLAGLLSLAKIGVCIAIICIVSIHLWDVDYSVDIDGKDTHFTAQCLMSGSVHGQSVCNYTYAVCGLSMLLSLAASLLLCFTCDLCGLGSWLEVIVGAFQTAWWVVASIVITKKVKDSYDFKLPDGSGLPNVGWSAAVAVLAWVAALLSLLLTLVYLVDACKCLKSCVCCCCEDDDDDKRNRV